MRRFALALLATSSIVGFGQTASAADLGSRTVSRAPVVAPVPFFSWSGLYVGAHIGGGWGDNDWSVVGTGVTASHDVSGFLGGGQIGFNYQINQWVFGIEGDMSWADLSGDGLCSTTAFRCHSDVNWIATLTGRVGVAFDRALVYVKGGAAWADTDYRRTVVATGAAAGSASETQQGWTVGAGLEYAFTPNWSAKVEYNFLDLGTDRLTFTDGSVSDLDQQIHALKVGVNYRFGWGAAPVTARY
jgi:outer membrane immunogenic protein